MSDVEIKYNNKRVPVSGAGPTPYLSLNNDVIQYGNRWGLVNRITLNGQITGLDFDAVYKAQTGLVDIFSSSYKTLVVYEGPDGASGYLGSVGNGGNGGNIGLNYSEAYSFSGCSVQGISFDNAGYNKIVNYSVELFSYPSGLTGYFTGFYGVIDPKDEIRISEGTDGFGTIEHNVEAKGFFTTSVDNAINNAKTYVASRTGVSRVINTPAISGIPFSGSISTPVLVSLAENLDRLNLTYSIGEVYRFKLFTGDTEAQNNYNFNNNYLTSYSTSLTSGAGEDFVTASIQGQIKAGITGKSGDALITDLVTQLSLLNPYKIISGKYGKPNGFEFCQDPIQFQIQEDLKARSINFNATYDNLEFYKLSNDKFSYSGCYLDASITHNIDELTKIHTLDVQGDIKCRGSVTNRYNSSLLYLEQLMTTGTSVTNPRLYDFVNDYYTGYDSSFASKFALNSIPLNIEVNANPILGTISLSATFNNKDTFLSLGNTDYTIEYTPSNTVYASASSCNDSTKHLAVDLNSKRREKVSLDFSISNPTSTESDLLDKKDSIYSSFLNNFINPLITSESTFDAPSKFDTLQVESYTINISNSNNTLPASVNKGTTLSTSKAYSYEISYADYKNRLKLKS